MTATLNFEIRQHMRVLYPENRLGILTVLMLHADVRNRCWPSVDLLAHETALSPSKVSKAKQWLLEHKAIELVPYDQRVGDEKRLPARQHVYQLTGIVEIDGKQIPYLYYQAPEVAPDVNPSDVGNFKVSNGSNTNASNTTVGRGSIESESKINTSKEENTKTLAPASPAPTPESIQATPIVSEVPMLKEVPKEPPSSGAPPVDKRNMHQRGVDAYYDNLPDGVRPKIRSYGGQVGNGVKTLLKEYSPEQIGTATAEAYKDDWWSEKANTPIPVQTLGQGMEILLRKAKFNGQGTSTEGRKEPARTNGMGTGVLASNTLTPEQELEYRQHLRRIAERQMPNVSGHAVDNKKRAG